ncbi:Serine/threonine-protein kinase PknB [Rosistilla carotiformis]|uniref:Serine/threonine-protein kinase PknB n=1 Tax=Rosistilla carotiformis TaxID=2528017 RepID=A0A518JPI3_9BACT|nr:protein kinase [Rosistilla carotiformis]QDV67460.1 Serine/threonine-protein kinase PknB [Rosistilla carotiformis]
MADDYTEQQSSGEQQDALKLSLQTTTPPAEVPGYRIERFLGAGAFGQVWVARDLNTGRPVAIKFYLHRGGVNWSLLSREVKNLVALSADSYIVQVLEVGWDSEPPYYVMELIENGSLEDLLHKRGRLPVERSVQLFREICIGMNHTHGKGILHCDLKPANVLLDEELRPRLADFGQSRLSHEQSPALGTLFYMAPEQADLDASPDVRWDVYGLGAILYRMLTGTAPHREGAVLDQIDTAGSLNKRLEKYRDVICQSGPPTGHEKVPGVDRRLGQILQRCLAPDPEHRYANVQQLVEAIDERNASKARRPLILLGLVGPLLLLTAMGLYAIRSIRETGKQFTTAMREERSKTNLSVAGEKSRALEIELRSYFDLVAHEASQPELVSTMSAALQEPRLTELRAQIAAQQDPEAAREEILDKQLGQPLEDYLSRRLQHYNKLAESQPGVPKLATIFVTDSQGTMIGFAHSGEVTRKRISRGRNYAFRTYFTGRKEDLPKETPAAEVKEIVQRTHLSTAFQSTATGVWKLAVSTPIRLPHLDASSSRDPEIDGVLVATTNFGDFEQFRVREKDEYDAIGVLVDARPGPLRGTILQHPWMQKHRAEHEGHQSERFQVSDAILDELLAGGDINYLDPIATAHGGENFKGNWIAAVQPVHLPQSEDGSGGETDWIVLVQFRLSKTIARVESLTNKLIAEGIIAALAILMVNGAMWYLVRRANSAATSDETDSESTLPVAMQETISIQD